MKYKINGRNDLSKDYVFIDITSPPRQNFS
jgi:hypothetical protein